MRLLACLAVMLFVGCLVDDGGVLVSVDDNADVCDYVFVYADGDMVAAIGAGDSVVVSGADEVCAEWRRVCAEGIDHDTCVDGKAVSLAIR